MPRRSITRERLARAGNAAAEKAMKDMLKNLKTETADKLSCTYLGTVEEDAPLRCNTRVTYEWKIDGLGSVKNENMVSKVLHCDLLTPFSLKTPLMVSCLPEAITKHRSLPAMLKYPEGDAVCRALAIARPYEADCQTTFINVGGRSVQHIMCARISGDSWFVHPGGILSTSDLFKSEVLPQDAAKKARLTAPTLKMEPVRPGELLSKLMAVAHFHAEIERAKIEGREPDLSVTDECFQKNPFEWNKTPKQVFVLWSSKSAEGGWEQHVSEASFASLSKRV